MFYQKYTVFLINISGTLQNVSKQKTAPWKVMNFHITNCFSCVCSPSLAVPSVFSKGLYCWESSGNTAHGVLLCLLQWIRRARCHNRHWEQETPQGLMSECETEASWQKDFWRPPVAAGCFSAQGDHRPWLQTEIKHSTMKPGTKMWRITQFCAKIQTFSCCILLLLSQLFPQS